nr:MAG: hypothetical protein [Bacteriophage sp.]
MVFDLKGEILFEDGLKVHFKYFDENNKEVPYSEIWGRQYEYRKLTNTDGTSVY